jgi:hypothetical protein
MLTIWRQFIHIQLRIARRVIHYAAAPAAVGPLRSIMDNVGNGIRGKPVMRRIKQRNGRPRRNCALIDSRGKKKMQIPAKIKLDGEKAS